MIGDFTEIKDAQGVGHPASYDELYGNITTNRAESWRKMAGLAHQVGFDLPFGRCVSVFGMADKRLQYRKWRNNIRYTKGKRYNGIEKYKHTNTLFASITGQF